VRGQLCWVPTLKTGRSPAGDVFGKDENNDKQKAMGRDVMAHRHPWHAKG
jgi:hypothetical protein